jgi:hypothetical protein
MGVSVFNAHFVINLKMVPSHKESTFGKLYTRFVVNDDFRAIYTLMVHLNDFDSFEGGTTNVYHCVLLQKNLLMQVDKLVPHFAARSL